MYCSILYNKMYKNVKDLMKKTCLLLKTNCLNRSELKKDFNYKKPFWKFKQQKKWFKQNVRHLIIIFILPGEKFIIPY